MTRYPHKTRWARLGVAALLCCACAQERFASDNENSARLCLLSATLESPGDPGTPASKATVSDDGTFSWTGSDQLAVWLSGPEKFQTFTLSSSEGSAARFEAELPEGAVPARLAVYPASSALLYSPGEQELTVNYPSVYDWSAEGVTAPPMVAILPEAAPGPVPANTQEREETLTLHHLGGILRMTWTDIPAQARRLVLTVPCKRISGEFIVNLSREGIPSVSATDSMEDGSVCVRFTQAQLTSPMTFDIPLPTGTYTHFSVKFQDAEGLDILTAKKVATSLPVNAIGRAGLRVLPSEAAADLTNRPSTAVVDATSSTLAFKFSTTKFEDFETDAQKDWTVALYRDAACQDLVVRWYVASTYYAAELTHQPRFVFSGLDRNKTYWFTASADGVESLPLSASTLPFSPVYLSSFAAGSANEGDVILNEDFKDFIWGGSWWNGAYAAGYVSNNTGGGNNMAADATFKPASGNNPTGVNKQAIVNSSTPFRLMHAYAHKNSETENGIIKSSSLADWNMFTYTQGWEAVRMAAGHVVIGHSPQSNGTDRGGYFAPALNCLRTTATLKVSFKAQNYGSKDPVGALYVLPGEKMSGINVSNNGGCLALNGSTASYDGVQIYEDYLVKKASFTLTGTVQEFSFTLTGITPGSRIGFCNDIALTAENTQHRWLLDDVKMEIVSYEE